MTTTAKEISNTDDVIDVREITERVEYLEEQPTLDDDGACYSCGSYLKDGDEDHESDCEVLELQRLSALLDDLKDTGGGDHDWRDGWYPLLLVRDDYFETFAREEAESIGLIDREVNWPYTCIDWAQAAEALQQDYTTVDFDGETYWYR